MGGTWNTCPPVSAPLLASVSPLPGACCFCFLNSKVRGEEKSGETKQGAWSSLPRRGDSLGLIGVAASLAWGRAPSPWAMSPICLHRLLVIGGPSTGSGAVYGCSSFDLQTRLLKGWSSKSFLGMCYFKSFRIFHLWGNALASAERALCSRLTVTS